MFQVSVRYHSVECVYMQFNSYRPMQRCVQLFIPSIFSGLRHGLLTNVSLNPKFLLQLIVIRQAMTQDGRYSASSNVETGSVQATIVDDTNKSPFSLT